MRTTGPITTKPQKKQFYPPRHANYPNRYWRNSDGNFLFWQIFFKKFGCVFFKVKLSFGHISGIVGLIDVKWKGSELMRYWPTLWRCLWPHPWPWPSSFKVKVWNSLISGTGWQFDMEWKGCESSIHDHDIDLCVTMVGWVDVPDSGLGDFRHQRAVNISSS